MKNRPKSITFISWFVIITSVMSLLNIIINLKNLDNPLVQEFLSKVPIPIPIQIIMSLIEIIIRIVSGIGMLKAQNWCRILYLITGVIGLLTGILLSPIKIVFIPGTIVLLIIVFFLYKPEANKYFNESEN